MSILPTWIKRLLGAIFLSFGVVLLGFAIGGIFGVLPDSFQSSQKEPKVKLLVEYPEDTETATFAAGCFWCTEAGFQEEPGVLDAVSGYVGGTSSDPTYEQVAGGKTDYREGVQVMYDPELVSYERLLEIFRESIDPTDAGGQFVDRGFQYTTAIFTHDEAQRDAAQKSLELVQELEDEPVATILLPYTTFYAAEDYHQDFYKNSKLRYEQYKNNSGREEYQEERDSRAEKLELRAKSEGIELDSIGLSSALSSYKEYPEPLEGETVVEVEIGPEDDSVTETTTVSREAADFVMPTQEELKEQLSFMQYRVSQNDGTEPPFANAYWNNKEEGIYVDIVSGEPLFSSKDQYKSGTGRPSFTQPIGGNASVVTLHEDTSLWTTRTEVRSAVADSHLGHLFDDGPVDAGGLRYCMNSAAMRFVAYEEMDSEGYGDWKEFVR